MLEIYPLATTTPDWGMFVEVCQRVLGFSPTRGLDDASLSPKDAAAFAASLNMENAPLDVLRHPSIILDHVSMSFLMVLEEEDLNDLRNLTALRITSKSARRHEHVCVVSASVWVWFQTINSMSDRWPEGTRWILNQVHKFFEQTGYKNLWYRYNRKQQTDGSYLLERGRN